MREIRSSGSAEGVLGNCDPYSDPSEPMVVIQPKCTVEGADIVMQSLCTGTDFYRDLPRFACSWDLTCLGG